MTPHRLMAVSLVIVLALFALAWWWLPAPRQDGLLPTLTPTRPITVLPTATGVIETTVKPTKTATAQPERLPPAVTSTRVPTLTATPIPTRTPRPELPPVQKGARDAAAHA